MRNAVGVCDMGPKKHLPSLLLLVLLSLSCANCDSRIAVQPPPLDDGETAKIRKARETLKPLHRRKGEPGANEWLDRFDEPGQTFEEYLACDPVRPSPARGKLYILLLGGF
ncbi:MAG: hypothetical protein ACYTFG_16475, partial [Planctomycetota bacterium]